MDDPSHLVEVAEEIVKEKTGDYLSELQRLILASSLQGDRKTYDQMAEECGYSPKYVRQDVAPKLWQLLSEVFGEKVGKSNIKGVLQRKIRHSTPSKPVHPVESVQKPVFSPRSSSSQGSKGNILLVDDQPQNLNLLAELLEEQGYEVREAINGELALQTVEMKAPDLILLDINMPNLDGYTVCQRLKSQPHSQDIPVIFVSALDEAWDKVRGFSVGGVDYIAKPFKAMEVLARVENHLKTRRLQQELTQKTIELEQTLQELSQWKQRDPVTQLGNLASLEQYFSEKWLQFLENDQSLTIILAQVAQWAAYCDRHGSLEGDHCLYLVAKILLTVFPTEKAGIFTYEEGKFAIILPHLPSNELTSLTTKLTDSIKILPLSTAITLKINPITVTPSLDRIAEDELAQYLKVEG